MKKGKIDVITLGCSKNLIDSERLMRQFEACGYEVAHDPERVSAPVVVINTCGFINDAKEESIRIILEMGRAKQQGKISRLYVMGCLSERFAAELRSELPEVDKFYGKFDWKQLLSDLGQTYSANLEAERKLSTPGHYAYIKVSEGCNRSCSFCSIPLMTGKYCSRTKEDILEEARRLAAGGVKELQVVAQDLTYYGYDLYGKAALPELVEGLSELDGIEWIRLHYAYPANFPWDLLRVIRERDKVCNYLDIALQHISDNMLSKMRRNISGDETISLLDRIRREVPGIHLRTTLMVGHPGETESDFRRLVDFVREMRFERMGAFMYSHEEGTWSHAHYSDDVSAETKQERLDLLMSVQEKISAEIQASKEGQTFKVIIDREERDYYIGRTEYDSPEVDPEVLIEKGGERLENGRFYPIRIQKSEAFELYGAR
ncbi:MAG: 30S ribosomal protein S12 methylthiotransferase RimO [Tannerellaceae bacterium]|jgi:ribosomal protein S12 methylthiotransferase|nr:30S ribosomal protein S12 methylthiotransferase RimO [Tannerellaceae bacterium]